MISNLELQSRLSNVLLEGLRTEEDSTNRQLILWTVAVFIYENIDSPDAKDFPHVFCLLLVSKIVSNSWSHEDTIQGINILAEMSNNFQLIYQANKETAPYVVSSLAKAIDNWMQLQKNQEPPEALITRAFYCLLEWIMADNRNHWILSISETFKAVLDAIEVGMTGNKVTSYMILFEYLSLLQV